ncbi:MAG TPA: enoyl-CoA hydratase-related protein [Chloroflexia bacterium]|jgi:methylglutaconyl-CoA hydratase|nr:enoyl-CoA hydratase-related protein [Chloroflexia bacterium]
MQQPQLLNVEVSEGAARVTLNRPEVRNAFNSQLIEEIRSTFERIGQGEYGEVRAVVLAGAGQSFCAGADVNWMRASLEFTQEQNVADALHMASMFDQVNRCPVPVIGRVHGAALGGGVGLAAVCDIVVAAEDAVWAFSEAKLGIAPAVISPYVLAKIGRTHARALFFTAERFDSSRAIQIGLAHIAVPGERLDEEVERLVREVKSSSARAIAWAKELIATVPALPPQDAMQLTAHTIAALRVSQDGQEGLRAFLEKRKPGWAS